MGKFLALVCAALVSTASLAAARLQDYAYQSVLSEGEQELQRIALPLDILLDLTRADLADLAVFNASGKALPHALTRARATEQRHTRDLPFYEFSSYLQQRSKTITTREQDRQAGTEFETTETLPVEARRRDYLIELAPDDATPRFDRIELRWRHEPPEQILEVRVEAGNTLDTLGVVIPRKRLSNLDSQDIEWRSIGGIPRERKYLRLIPLNSATSFRLLQVIGHYRESIPAPRLAHRLEPERVRQKDRAYFAFEIPSKVPPQALRIVPRSAHSVIEGDLYAGPADFEQARRTVVGFRQHNISDDDVRPSEPIDLSQRGYSHYWFDTRDESAATPQVELIYPRYEVVFLGDGNPPYTLAWGNYESGPGNGNLQGLLQMPLDEARQRSTAVTPGPRQEAGGERRLAPEPELPWQKWLLWALLVFAALITGGMATRLYREMNSAAPQE